MSKLKPIAGAIGAVTLLAGSYVAGMVAQSRHKKKNDEETPAIIMEKVRTALDNMEIGIQPSKKDEENMRWVMALYDEHRNASTIVYLNKIDDMGLNEDDVEALAKECSDYFIKKEGDSL